MQIFDYIRLRMINMGYDPDDVAIEPYIEIFEGGINTIEATNIYYYLYDVINYENTWEITSDTELIDNSGFIIDMKIPYGISELTGNIEITSSMDQPNKFMFYKVSPGRVTKPEKRENTKE